MRRPAVALGGAMALAGTTFVASGVRAQTPGADDPCLSTPVEGQQLRRDGHLLQARDRFVFCGRDTCPATIVQSCVRWKAEVDAAIPSVVLVARDARGRDVGDATASIDGKSPVPVGALAIELDPGSHRLVFTRAVGGAAITQDVVLREGEKDRQVIASFPGGAEPSPPAAVEHERPVPALVWVLGALGVAATASFGTFGVLGLTVRSAHNCDSGCTQSQYDDMTMKLRIADVSLAVAIVAFGAATWLYLSRPASRTSAATWIDLHPLPGGGAAGLAGAF